MTAVTESAVVADPESRSAASWSATLAALKSRGTPDNDHRVIECRQALAYWRHRRVIDAEAGNLSGPAAESLARLLTGKAVSR